MFLFDEILSIDYGTTHIKGILFKKLPGDLQIIQQEMMEIQHLKDEDGFKFNLNRFVSGYFPNTTSFLMNISVKDLYIRDLSLPVVSTKTLKEIIPFEVESVVPFPMENLVNLHKIWKIEEDLSHIITFNCHHDEISRILAPFIENRWNLKALSIDSYSLASLLKSQYKAENEEKITAQLDIGGTGSIFNVCAEGNLCFSRYFNTGSSEVVDKVAALLKKKKVYIQEMLGAINFEFAAEKDKELKKDFLKRFKITQIQLNQILKIIQLFHEKLASETRRGIYSLPEGYYPSRIFLSGGGSLIENTEKTLEEKVQLPVSRYQVEKYPQDPYLLCYSNITHYLLNKKEKLDFLGTDFTRKMNIYSFNFKTFIPHLLIFFVSLLLLVSVFIASLLSDRKKIQANELILGKKYEAGFGKKVPEGLSAMDAANLEIRKEFKNTEIFRKFYNKLSALDILMEITEKFPPNDSVDFQLIQMVYDNNEIMVHGNVREFSDIGTIQDNLSRSKMVKSILVVNKKLLTGAKTLKVRFQMKIQIRDTAGENDKSY